MKYILWKSFFRFSWIPTVLFVWLFQYRWWSSFLWLNHIETLGSAKINQYKLLNWLACSEASEDENIHRIKIRLKCYVIYSVTFNLWLRCSISTRAQYRAHFCYLCTAHDLLWKFFYFIINCYCNSMYVLDKFSIKRLFLLPEEQQIGDKKGQ